MSSVTPQRAGQVVFTNKARCRDCYRCVRVCPVKAIRMHQGQAFVDEQRCINCGTCIRECPQGAKTFRNDVDRAARLIAAGAPVAASIAPSFAAVFQDWERNRIASALRKLGFSYVAETAIGAYHVAARMAEIVANENGHPHIATACPAVVNYVELYCNDLVKMLLPVVSPMLAHARHIKAKLGPEVKVVFIGPCVAKKAEAERPEHAGLVDCVLTFVELVEWLGREGIQLAGLEESRFDEEPEGDARFFPLLGGAVRTAHLNTDLLTADVIDVHGFQDTKEALESLSAAEHPLLVEALFCPLGCINGPAIPGARNLYERRSDLLDFATRNKGKTPYMPSAGTGLETTFEPKGIEHTEEITEDQIRQVLEKTGKSRPEDQLNCGACGYSSCREKAIAVVRGLAEPEMCIPYLRRLAERRTDKIIETSPNGIVILDEKLNIVSMNPTFRRMFMCSEAVCGKRISYLMDPAPFERLASEDEDLIEIVVKHDKYSLVCYEKLYPLRQDRQYVGIFANITKSQADKEKLDQLRSETIRQARELLEHQIGLAQKIAVFLGESTSRGEELVEKLVQMATEEHSDQTRPNNESS
jgi:iron only hydrogenase large subunit-like protein/uncharacterized Fe-S cluster-containing protein